MKNDDSSLKFNESSMKNGGGSMKSGDSSMKVALVCDWLTNVGGAEKVLLKFHQMFPEAPIYTSKYDPKGIDWFSDAEVKTGWLQKFPTKLRRILGPLRQIYFSHLDLSGYDLVISVTGAEAKAVKVSSGIHVSYCHVPTQYYWQMYDEYIKNPGFGVLNPIVRLFFRLLVIPLRRADLKAAQRPDFFITISEYAKEMIRKYYGREAVVIHPPVELEDFQLKNLDLDSDSDSASDSAGADSVGADLGAGKFVRGDYYVITSRQVNWKRVDLAVKAAEMSQRKLKVIGEGPEHKKLMKLAKGSGLVKFVPLIKDRKKLAKELAEAKGYLFPSLEPFGIAPVEALAAGCPVIAFGEGGARDYVLDGKNGILFEEQTAVSLAEAILRFEKMEFSAEKVSRSAEKFSEERFEREVRNFLKHVEKKRGKGGVKNVSAKNFGAKNAKAKKAGKRRGRKNGKK